MGKESVAERLLSASSTLRRLRLRSAGRDHVQVHTPTLLSGPASTRTGQARRGRLQPQVAGTAQRVQLLLVVELFGSVQLKLARAAPPGAPQAWARQQGACKFALREARCRAVRLLIRCVALQARTSPSAFLAASETWLPPCARMTPAMMACARQRTWPYQDATPASALRRLTAMKPLRAEHGRLPPTLQASLAPPRRGGPAALSTKSQSSQFASRVRGCRPWRSARRSGTSLGFLRSRCPPRSSTSSQGTWTFWRLCPGGATSARTGAWPPRGGVSMPTTQAWRSARSESSSTLPCPDTPAARLALCCS